MMVFYAENKLFDYENNSFIGAEFTVILSDSFNYENEMLSS